MSGVRRSRVFAVAVEGIAVITKKMTALARVVTPPYERPHSSAEVCGAIPVVQSQIFQKKGGTNNADENT
jgi:hypothetical protein